MPDKYAGVSDTELVVLEVLWQLGACTMQQIADQVYPDGRASRVANVQKLLQRLVEKKKVQRQRLEGAWTFEPLVEREDLIDDQLRSTAEKFCGGSVAPLFSRLIQAKKLSAKERQQLRELIDELEKK